MALECCHVLLMFSRNLWSLSMRMPTRRRSSPIGFETLELRRLLALSPESLFSSLVTEFPAEQVSIGQSRHSESEAEGEGALVEYTYQFVSLTNQSLDPNPNDSIKEYRATVGDLVKLQVFAQDLRNQPQGVFATGQNISFVHQDGQAAELLGLSYGEGIELAFTDTAVDVGAKYRIRFGDGEDAIVTEQLPHPMDDGVLNAIDRIRIGNAINRALKDKVPGYGSVGIDVGGVSYNGRSGGYYRFYISFARLPAFRLDIPNVTIVENGIVSSTGSESVIATSYDPNPQLRQSLRGSVMDAVEYIAIMGQNTSWDTIATGFHFNHVGSIYDNGAQLPSNPSGKTLQFEALFKVIREGSVVVSGEFADPNAMPTLLFGLENSLTESVILFPTNVPFYAVAAGSDRFEPNNSFSSSTNLGTLQGQAEQSALSIHQASDEDWFQFTTVAVGAVTHFISANFIHAVGDIDIELYDQAGTKIASSNTASNEERISLQGLPAGTYFARVIGFNSAANSDYQIHVQAPSNTINADRFEANNTVATATNFAVLTAPQTTSGVTIHSTSDEDHYRFETSATGKVDDYVQIDFAHGAGDLELRLLNPAGLVLASSKTANDFERISLNGRPAGVYVIQVLGENNARSPDYRLKIDPPAVSIAPDSFESNNSLATAKSLNLSQAFSEFPQLTIHQTTDQDWYSFQLTEEGRAGHFISIDFENRTGDIDVQLLNSTGTVLRSSATAQNQERISLAGLSAGIYFVRVFGNQNATQPNYQLSVSVPVATLNPDSYEANDTFATASNLRGISGDMTIEQLNIDRAADVDWFRFETTAVGTSSHFVGLTYRTGGSDINLELYNQNGDLLESSSLNDNWEIINFSSRPAGTYFVRIYGASGGVNADYTLGFTLPRTSFLADRFELNNTSATATDLKKLSEATIFDSLSIHNAEDVDWYRFATVAAGNDRHFIELSSSTALGNLEIELYDSQGGLLERSNGWDDVERISLRGRPVGTYFLRVLGINGATSGYDLSLQVPTSTIPADAYESNNQREQAVDLRSVEGSLHLDDGTLHQAGDQDWFRFELLSTATTSHYVLADFRHALGDVELELYDELGRLIRTSTSSIAPESVSLAGLPVGVYFIRVFGYQDATSPHYSLEVLAPLSGNMTPDRYESNNSLATATIIRSSGELLVGALAVNDLNLHATSDQDYFRFNTVAGSTSAHSVSLEFNPGDGDLNLYLLDAAGNTIRQSTQTAETESISLAGLAAGSYYVLVRGQENATNDYRLRFDTPVTSGQQDAWTILVYMTASDLESFAFEDVNELEAAAQLLPGNVNLAILWDQSAQRSKYASDHGSQPAWGTIGRAFVQPDNNLQSVATRFEILPEENTGSSQTLTDFVNWTFAAAPADNYALIAWDHGSGIFGSNYDNADSASVDNLKISEFISALSAAEIPEFQILSFDACLMAMAEVAHAARNVGEILVTSQEVVGARGYDYTTLFSSLIRNPRASAIELAAGMVNSYQASYASDTNGWNTQSAISLSSMSQLANSIGSFTAAASSLTVSQWQAIAIDFDKAIGYATPDFRDLGSALSSIVQNSILPTLVRDAAAQVIQDLDAAVISLAADSRNSSGLSIFAPKSSRELGYFNVEFSEFAAQTGWSEFLTDMIRHSGNSGGNGERFGRSVSNRDWAESNDRFATATNLFQISGNNIAYSGLSLHDNNDVDWFRFNIAADASSSHQIQVNSAGSGSVILELYDATGLVPLRQSQINADPTLSMTGLAAGEYTLRVSSPTFASVADYTLLVDAPNAAAIDRTGANTSLDRAYPLGLVSERLTVPGLSVHSQSEEWFSFATPKLPNAQWYSIEIPLGASGSADAILRDRLGNIVSRASGNNELLLSYRASGSGEVYSLQIISRSTQVVTFSIRVASLTATFPDVIVTERLIGTSIDRLPLTELVDTVGGVHISDPRFMWQDNQLLLQPGIYLDREEQLFTQLRIEVSDATQPDLSTSFILPITLLSNPFPWHNLSEPKNANSDRDNFGNQVINAIDALVIINFINRNGVGKLPAAREASPSRTEYLYDVDNNSFINATDALIVINYLRFSGGSGEGEGEDRPLPTASTQKTIPNSSDYPIELGLVDLLAEDHQRRRRVLR